MRLFLFLLSFLLAIGTVAVAFADYSHVPVVSPLGLRLGRFYLLQDDMAVESALSRYDSAGFASAEIVVDDALQRDPGSAYRWCDKGDLLLQAGHPDEAERCYNRAGELAPKDLRILLNIGDFYSTIGKPEIALKNFFGILSQTGVAMGDVLVGNVFTYYERMKVRQSHLLDEAIPDATNAAAYSQYVSKTGDVVAMREVWDWACGKGFDTDHMALDYTALMFQKGQIEAAGEGWVKHFSRRNDGYPQSSRIFNGGFEHEITNGAFDWQFSGPESVKAARDRLIRQAGDYSYRIDFSGNDNLNYHHFTQNVYVHPGKYRFEAWIRTSKITSDEGIRFRLRTSRDTTNFAVETPALTGTNDWTRLEQDIDVPPGNPLLKVELVRRPSLRIDNQLTGTVWIDSVTLTPR